MVAVEGRHVEDACRLWTEMPVGGVSVSDLDPKALEDFRRLAVSSGRLSPEVAGLPREGLLEALDLTVGGRLKRAAVLLFHPDPGRVLGPTYVKIGMFEGPELLFLDEFSGPLIHRAIMAADILTTKYMLRTVKHDGIVRMVMDRYPELAVREAVMNAVVHNDYSQGIPIQIKVTADDIWIFNSGGLPSGWTVDTLIGRHDPVLRNPSIASAFYRAGLMELSGSGIGMMGFLFEGCSDFPPVFRADPDFSVELRKPTKAR
ncbi:MAG: ATP-binding protein [Thermoplasmata archaeon]|nr:ATP-binding protein [Thermoplasmata archaeon]